MTVSRSWCTLIGLGLVLTDVSEQGAISPEQTRWLRTRRGGRTVQGWKPLPLRACLRTILQQNVA